MVQPRAHRRTTPPRLQRRKPGGKPLRAALKRWAFNTARRDDPTCPDDVRGALRWAASHTRPVSALREPRLLRQVLDGLTVKLDGTPAAPSVASRQRRVLHAALEYAVELELLDTNPMPALKWTPPKTTHGVDRRRVANPIQARTLLHAVGEQRGGRRLVAFFACLYFTGLRPEEAIGLPRATCRSPGRDGASCTSSVPSPTPAGSGPTAATAATGARSSSAPAARFGSCPARRR
jgi:integrase